MNWSELEPKASSLTSGLKGLMNNIESLTMEDKRYPSLTETFIGAKECIENPSYNIVVCGEMKKGKSSLLNAIIGQDILPVANQVATSQVFRIANSATESFELVFSDGSRKVIEREQLSYYGSQVDANLYGDHAEEFEGKVLEYIQVNMPIEFLPKGVNLIDTPGLGAVYKSHEYITQNYIRKASAVLFVFDPERPLVDLEQEFIKKVLEVTPHIMFVMTKIDMYKSSEWSEQLERTKESLAKLFAEHKCPAPDVYPMSSLLLAEAAKEEEPDFRQENVETSLFPAVKSELLHIIYKAVGLSYTSRAIYESQSQIIKVRKVITDLIQVASDEGKQLAQQLAQEKRDVQQRLEREWGEQSAQNKQVAEDISAICNNVVVNKVQQMFRSTGSIRTYYQNRIEGLSDMDEVKELCEEMPRSLTTDIASQWSSIMDDAKDAVSALLNEKLSSINNFAYGNVSGVSSDIEVRSLSFEEKLGNFRNQFFTGNFIAVVAGTICPPLAPILAIGAQIWAWLGGKTKNDEQVLKKNKANLQAELGKMLEKMSSQLLDVQPGHVRSTVNEFVYQLKKAAEASIAETVNKQKEQMRQQLADLEGQSNMSVEEKKQEVQVLTQRLKSWNELVPVTKGLTDQFVEIEKVLAE